MDECSFFFRRWHAMKKIFFSKPTFSRLEKVCTKKNSEKSNEHLFFSESLPGIVIVTGLYARRKDCDFTLFLKFTAWSGFIRLINYLDIWFNELRSLGSKWMNEASQKK